MAGVDAAAGSLYGDELQMNAWILEWNYHSREKEVRRQLHT